MVRTEGTKGTARSSNSARMAVELRLDVLAWKNVRQKHYLCFPAGKAISTVDELFHGQLEFGSLHRHRLR